MVRTASEGNGMCNESHFLPPRCKKRRNSGHSRPFFVIPACAEDGGALDKTAQEGLSTWELRCDQHIVRAALLNHHALIHKDHPIGRFACKTDLMRDDDHGQALLSQRAHGSQHFTDQLGIECRGGFVKHITVGRIASVRAMATRCCCPPDRWRG